MLFQYLRRKVRRIRPAIDQFLFWLPCRNYMRCCSIKFMKHILLEALTESVRLSQGSFVLYGAIEIDWRLESLSRQKRSSLRGRRLKGKGKGVLGPRETRGRARREGGRETPARKPLFSPSRLLIMSAKITQLWMTNCQISLAAMRLFTSYFAHCFSLFS